MSDDDEGVVGFIQFVLPREHLPELLDITKVTLYNIPSFVQFFIVFPRLRSIAFRRNHWNHATLDRLRSARIALIRLLHRQRFMNCPLIRKTMPNNLQYHITMVKHAGSVSDLLNWSCAIFLWNRYSSP